MSGDKASAETKARISDIERSFMRQLEEKNQLRVNKLLASRKFNRKVGLGLGAVVVGIYGYTIYAIKQETFLDNFDVPEVINKE